MTGGHLLALLAAGLSSAPADASKQEISLTDRCAIVRSILASRAKQQIPRDPHLGTVDVALTEIDHIGVRTRRAGRTVVRAQLLRGKRAVPFFALADSCGNEGFLLDHEQTPMVSGDRDPERPEDLVVSIELRPARTDAAGAGFRFEERLGLDPRFYRALPGHGKGGGFALPPTRYSGSVTRDASGAWIAKVAKAIFAS